MKSVYRSDIDGLRAIAVVSVLLSHAGISLFAGGYIGVDVFLVISGYLITTIIIREVDARQFSIAAFYERRIRRIYPALFTMLFFTLIVTSILYDAQSFMGFSKSLIATTFFFSNIHFWTESGYFEVEAQLKPLLHTWSLAVEEQYYIFFPLIILAIARYFRPKLPHILMGLAILSFGWNLYEIQVDYSGAFYLAHLRAWELLIGGVLALNPIATNTKSTIRNILSLIGLGMILAPVFYYSENTPFPGLAAAVPAIGTALIIYSGIENSTFVNKLLGIPPLVFIGQISYSLYLWHWPLIKFTSYYAIQKLTRPERVLLLVVIFIISALSWHFIEKPFRTKVFQKRSRIFLYAASAMAVAAMVGFFIYFNKGFPSQQNTEITMYQEQALKYKDCNFSDEDSGLLKFCPIGADMKEPSFLLWGDSHAGAQAESIRASAAKQGVAGLLTYNTGCPPLLNIEISFSKTCVEFNNMTLSYIESHPEITTVFLAGRWAYYAEGIGYKESAKVRLLDVVPENAANVVFFKRGLTRTVEKILKLGRKVVIISQAPEVKYDVPSAYYIAQRTDREINEIIAPTLDEYISRNKKVFHVIDLIRTEYSVQVVDPWKALCNENQCPVVVDNTPLYMDANHLSFFGAQYISHIYDPIFKELGK